MVHVDLSELYGWRSGNILVSHRYDQSSISGVGM